MDPNPSNSFRILAVDDEQPILDLYRNVLSPNLGDPNSSARMQNLAGRLFGNQASKYLSFSFRLTLCHQGDEAVEMARRALEEGDPYGLVFLDIRMPPGPDGVWTAENLREMDPYLNIVIVTAYSDFDTREIARRVPPLDKLLYIQKPFHLQEILQFASALGAKWNAEKMLRHSQAQLEMRVEERTRELARVNEEMRKQIIRQKQMQDWLERMISVLRATFDSAVDGILVVDNESGVVNFNQMFVDMWNIPTEALREGSTDWLDCIKRQLKNPETCEKRLQSVSRDREHESFDFIESSDGRMLELSSLAQRISGKVVGRVWNFRDITKRKQAEEALRHSENQLRQAQKMEALGKLAGGVAHDFNNHLTAISGYADLLLHTIKTDPKAKHRAEEIRKAADRATSLTRQLLAFSRRQVLQIKIVDLNAIILNMEKMLKRLIGENIDLIADLNPAIGNVKADPGQLEQVIMNLVVNARDAMPSGGTIRLVSENVTLNSEDLRQPGSANGSQQFVMLSVSDNGIGMDEETKVHIFEPFWSTKAENQGTGLGLSTVYGIVRQSGGHIDIESAPNLGSAFRIYFPRAAGVAEEIQTQTHGLLETAGNETILLAEDEDGVRNLLIEALSNFGYTILSGSDGAEAMEISKAYKGDIALLLTDLIMPQVGGMELAANILQHRPNIKVLFMSGYTRDSMVQQTIQDTNAMFLAKPFSMSELTKTIRSALADVAGSGCQ